MKIALEVDIDAQRVAGADVEENGCARVFGRSHQSFVDLEIVTGIGNGVRLGTCGDVACDAFAGDDFAVNDEAEFHAAEDLERINVGFERAVFLPEDRGARTGGIEKFPGANGDVFRRWRMQAYFFGWFKDARRDGDSVRFEGRAWNRIVGEAHVIWDGFRLKRVI